MLSGLAPCLQLSAHGFDVVEKLLLGFRSHLLSSSQQRLPERGQTRHTTLRKQHERLQASDQLTAKQRRELRDRHESLDPFTLAAEVERRLEKILRLGGSRRKERQ